MASPCLMDAWRNATQDAGNGTAPPHSAGQPRHVSVISGLLLLTAFFGVPLNAVALHSVTSPRPRARLAPYVLCLVTADLLFLLFQGVHTTCRFAGVPPNEPGLLLLRCIIVACNESSAFLLAWVSLERALALAYPHWWRTGRSRAWATPVCVSCWSSGLVLGALYGLGRSRDYGATQRAVIWLDFGLAFAVPLAVFTAANAFVCFRGRSALQRQSSRLQAAILVNAGVFLACWVPYNVFVLLYYRARWSRSPALCSWSYLAAYYSVCLLNLKSCLVPLLYVLPSRDMGGRLRRSLPSLFERRFSEDSGLSSPPETPTVPGPGRHRAGSCW